MCKNFKNMFMLYINYLEDVAKNFKLKFVILKTSVFD